MINSKRTGIGSLLALCCVLLISACDKQEGNTETEILRPVRTMKAISQNPHIGRDFPGVVMAENRADLSFRVPGKLKSLHFREGQRVSKGDLLAQLDKTDFEITLEDKKASFDEAKANFERAGKLVGPGHISQREFDQIKATYSNASAQLRSAEQDLKYTTLTAPFDGSITRTYVENFEEITAKQRIATLQDLDSLEIEIDVPESLMIRVKRDGRPRSVYARFDAIEDEFPLTVGEVSTQADENTNTYKVRLRMQSVEDYVILPGMTATVIVDQVETIEDNDDAIIIPSHAVLEDTRGRFVYVAVPAPGGDNIATVVRREVTVDGLSTYGITITSGLQPTDDVIIAGMSMMHEGLRVRLMPGGDI